MPAALTLQPFPASIGSLNHLSHDAAIKYNQCRVSLAHIDAQLYALKKQASILGTHVCALMKETQQYAEMGIADIQVDSHVITIEVLYDGLELSRECLKKIFDSKNLARSDLRICLSAHNRTMKADKPQLPELSYEEKGEIGLQLAKELRSNIVNNFQKSYDIFQDGEPSEPTIFEFTKEISEILGKPLPAEARDFSDIDNWIGSPDSIDPRV